MLNDYISAAMRQAHYEILAGDEGFYGAIAPLQGVWAQGATLEECREALKSALLFSLTRQQPVPPMNGIDLAIREVDSIR